MSSSTTPPRNGMASHGNSEAESSPVYQALLARIVNTENALSSLSSQVAALTALVKNLTSPTARAPGSNGHFSNQQQPVFSPFDTPDQTPFAPTSTLSGSNNGHGGAGGLGSSPGTVGNDPTVQALTTQIQALSTSVAQLQRLQTQQRHPAGMSLHLDRPSPMPSPAPSAAATPGVGGMMSPGGMFSRPPINRSISAMSAAGAGNGEDKWGQGPHQRLSNGPQTGGAGSWGAAGMGGAMTTPSLTLGGAPGTPGAGLAVTRWDQLGLKMELLRSIQKYGLGPPNKIQSRVLPFMGKPQDKDIIAQAPPTQERMLAYVVPAIQLCLTMPQQQPYRGPNVVVITTTVDQATQCQKFIRGIGNPVGIRSSLAAGVGGSSNLPNEIAAIHREAVHILIGTPVKINEIFSSGEVSGAEVRLLILDEVDQLIARNLHHNVISISKLLPAPRRPGGGGLTPGGTGNGPFSPNGGVSSPYDPGQASPFNPQSKTPFPGQARFGAPGGPGPIGAPTPSAPAGPGGDRQTCFFSNTIPTDVITLSQTLGIRDPIRVMVRKEGNSNAQESVSSVSQRINVKHTYVYLAITGSARSDGAADGAGVGTIGSGRAANGQVSEEASRAKEYKLDILVKMLEDYPLWQAVIHVGTFSMLEAVMYKLGGRSWEALYLTPDMPQSQRKQVLQSWRHSISPSGPRFLVIFDVNVKPPDIPWAPLVVNFDLPRSVEGYAHRAAAAVPPPQRGPPGQGSPQGVIVNFVQAAGGDVEMLRSTECAYTFKCAEIPSVFHDLFQYQ